MKVWSLLRWPLAAAGLVVCVAAATPGTVTFAQNGLEPRVTYLENAVAGLGAQVASLETAVVGILSRLTALENPSPPADIHVNCGTDTIQAALASTANRPGPVTIIIHGTCT